MPVLQGGGRLAAAPVLGVPFFRRCLGPARVGAAALGGGGRYVAVVLHLLWRCAREPGGRAASGGARRLQPPLAHRFELTLVPAGRVFDTRAGLFFTTAARSTRTTRASRVGRRRVLVPGAPSTSPRHWLPQGSAGRADGSRGPRVERRPVPSSTTTPRAGSSSSGSTRSFGHGTRPASTRTS